MAQGFVVATLDDDGDPVEFWDGTSFQVDLDLADVIATKPQARYVAGSNQAVRTDVDVVIKSVNVDVTLVP